MRDPFHSTNWAGSKMQLPFMPKFASCPRREWKPAGAGESIEPALCTILKVGQPSGPLSHVPGGNGAAGKRATWTKPRRGERSGECESVEPSYGIPLKLPTVL